MHASKPPAQQTPSTTQTPGLLSVPQLRPRSTQGRGKTFSIWQRAATDGDDWQPMSGIQQTLDEMHTPLSYGPHCMHSSCCSTSIQHYVCKHAKVYLVHAKHATMTPCIIVWTRNHTDRPTSGNQKTRDGVNRHDMERFLRTIIYLTWDDGVISDCSEADLSVS